MPSHGLVRWTTDIEALAAPGASALRRSGRPAPALELFESKEEIEKELTEFLTGYNYHIRRLRAQATAAQ